MLGILIKKELLDNFYSLRFMISSVICVFIILMSVFVLRQDYITKNEAYQNTIVKGRELAAESENYMELMFMGIRAARPPSKFQFLYTGVEKNPDIRTNIRSMLSPTFQGDLNFNPVLSLFPVVDLMFVVSIVMSLLAFVYSYDAVCGEREKGTLKLLMSYSVPRDKIILAKWIGGYVSLLIPYFIGVTGCAILIVSSSALAYNGQDWIIFALTIFVSLLFIAVMYSLGLFVSVISKRSNTSISILLLIWVIFVLIIPNMSPFAAEWVSSEILKKDIPSVSQVRAEIQVKTGDQMEDLIITMLANFEKVLQRHLPGFTWRNFKFGGEEREEAEQKQQQQEQGPGRQAQKEMDNKQEGTSGAQSGGQAQKEGSGLSGDEKRQAEAAGVNASDITSIMGQLTEQDLRDIKTFGCRSFLDNKLKQLMDMSLDDAKKMAAQYGMKASDIDNMLDECEVQKSRYLARLNSEIQKQGAEGGDTSAAQTQTQQKAAPEQAQTDSGEQKRYSWDDLQKIVPNLTDQDKREVTRDFWGGFVETSQSNMRETSLLWEDRNNAVAQQIALTKNIARISPVSAFIFAVTDLADTGVEHDIYLREDYLGTYQDLLSKFLESQLGMPYDKMPGKFDPFGIIREPPKPKQAMKEFQKYDYTPMPLMERLQNVVIDMFVLFFFMVLFFMLAYVSFLRAQIID